MKMILPDSHSMANRQRTSGFSMPRAASSHAWMYSQEITDRVALPRPHHYGRPKAMIAIHMEGYPADLDARVVASPDKRGLALSKIRPRAGPRNGRPPIGTHGAAGTFLAFNPVR